MSHNKNFPITFLLNLLIVSCFILWPQKLLAIACSDIFSNGIQAHAATGNINFGYQSRITGGGATLATRTLTDNSAMLACSGFSCAASGSPSATSTPTFQVTNASNGAINVGFQGSQNISSGNFGTVNVAQEGSLRFNTNSGLYLTRAVTTGYRSELRIRTGDYWIDGNLNLGQETVLRRIAAAGSTRIFVRGNVSIGYQVTTDGFTSNQLLIYATGTISTNQYVDLHAFLYAGGNVTLDYGAVINGGVAGANVSSTSGRAIVNYQGNLLSSADFEPFCGGISNIDHYELQMPTESVACAGSVITVRACADSSVPCTKLLTANGTVNLSTNLGGLGATTLTLTAGEATTTLLHAGAVDGAVATVTLSNEQTAGANPRKCCTSTSNCTVANSCSTQFKTAGFIFSNNATTSGNIPTQISGTTDANVFLRAVKTNTTTGACVARFSTPQTVQLAYQCVNPTTCVAGQTLSLGGTGIQSNANSVAPASISYTNKAVNFDANGSAVIPLNYTDVGQIHLSARLALAATATEPAYTLTGVSNDFVVKPHSLVVSAVTNSTNVANPGSTAAGAGFVAAGEKFKVSVQARNSAASPTPNFGNEITPEKNNFTLTADSLVYPAGGALTALTNGGTFTATTPAGTFVNPDILWNQVGSITLMPGLGDNDYLGAGNIPNFIQSSTVGRFYPDHYRVASSSTSEGCGSFSYMGQPNIVVNYSVLAESVSGVVLTNYDNKDQATPYAGVASPFFVAEDTDSGNGSLLSSRVSVPIGPSLQWDNGSLILDAMSDPMLRSQFSRAALAVPDGPYTSLQLGMGLTDTLDSRSLQNHNMNANTTGICTAASCNAVALGNSLNLRYGRLRLDDAFGPETVDLSVNFATEYWTGNFFTKNTDDSCTGILRSAISYPNGTILNAANLVVPLSGGSTTGVYEAVANTPTEILFQNGDALHKFQAPGSNATGNFTVDVNLVSYDWLRFDWNQNGNYNDDTSLPTARYGFGSYRGHDRIIYWRERFQ